MRGAAVVVIASLAACGDEAIVLEIKTAAAPTETVELFIGTSACDEPACEGGIAPPGTFGRLPGDIYFRDNAKRFTSTVDKAGIARFRLEPSDLGDEVKFLLAVGAPSGTTTGAVLISPIDPASGPLRVIAELEPVAQFDPQNPASPELDGVQIWSDPNGVSTCVMFQRVKDGGEVVREFVVPDADRDCDAIEPDRCDEYTPDASTKPSSLADARCGISDGAVPFCRLGGFQCSDRGGDTGSCGPLPYCVGITACSCAGGSHEEMSACLDGKFAAGSGSTRLVCEYPVTRSPDVNDPTHFDICGEPGRLAALPFPTGATGMCGVELSPSALGPYDSSHVLAENDHLLTVGVTAVEPDVCKISVSAAGNLSRDPVTLPPLVYALKVEADQPTARGAILPLEIRFFEVETCLQPAIEPCHMETGNDGDGLFRCQ